MANIFFESVFSPFPRQLQGLWCRTSPRRWGKLSSLHASAAPIPLNTAAPPAEILTTSRARVLGNCVTWLNKPNLINNISQSWHDTFAPSYLAKATSGPGLVTGSAEDRMRSKYSIFILVVIPGRPWPPPCTCHRRSQCLPVPEATVIHCHPKGERNFTFGVRWTPCFS